MSNSGPMLGYSAEQRSDAIGDYRAGAFSVSPMSVGLLDLSTADPWSTLKARRPGPPSRVQWVLDSLSPFFCFVGV